MDRPYFRKKIDELEALFIENPNATECLIEIKKELEHRTTSKSKSLLQKIDSALDVSIKVLVEADVHHGHGVKEKSNNDKYDFPDISPLEKNLKAQKINPINEKAAKASAILDYWRSVETFSPQKAPKDERNSREPVYIINRGDSMPWDENHLHQSKRLPQNVLWRFSIYGGIFSTKYISDALGEVFGRDEDVSDERVDGDAALFSIGFTHKAKPLIESFILSTSGWALGRLKNPGHQTPDWLDGFESTESHIRSYISKVFEDETDDEGKVGRIVSGNEVFKLLEKIQKFLSFPNENIKTQIIVRCTPVHFKKISKTEDLDVLNSFYIKDLRKVSNGVASGRGSESIMSYLESDSISPSNRTDVRKESPLALCWDKLRPVRYPFSKWPSRGHHSLVYSQQIAVNEITDKLKDKGIFGVNGPPGTGKTTLLRDIIANLVTERAQALAKLEDPKNGFKRSYNWKVGTWQRKINIIHESLRGFDMIVASANNGAVENVTMELPGIDAIDASWLNEIDYFSKFATQIVGQKAWGLISARLGNKSNRRDFLSRFWYGNIIEDDTEELSEESEKPVQRDGFRNYLSECQGTVNDWDIAVKRFKEASQNEMLIRQSREKAWTEVLEKSKYLSDKKFLENKLLKLSEQINAFNFEYNKSQSSLEEGQHKLAEVRTNRLTHHAFKPIWWMVLFTLGGAYREWRKPDLEYQSRISALEREIDEFKQELKRLEIKVGELNSLVNKSKAVLNEIVERLSMIQSKIEKSQSDLKEHHPYNSNWSTNESVRELSSPWMDPEWGAARTRVFIAALQLHKEFIHSNAQSFRQNLDAFSDVLSGNLPANASAESVQAAWDSFFVLIPVVSTTFASIDRLLPFHEENSIAWLFIDEAGQVTPQAAAGALWRAKRAVVVGDPLQLEPILSLPFTAQDALRKYFSVDSKWRPGQLSCQSLADRQTALGTLVPTDDEPLWVGAPLRVHRRCDKLMFDVSNTIAYDGLMIYGKPNLPEHVAPESSWLDIQSEDAESHWVPKEGDALQTLLEQLFLRGVTAKNIFLISPFRTVVYELYRFSRKYEGLRTGTIHTVQGKEAEIVILVLGGNPKRPGAKDWAAKKPNMLNVAVSRAQRRIYIIGNKNEWSKRRYFDKLAHFV